jgi:hypothetical protein
MAKLYRHPRRRGSLIPLLAVSAISLFAFVALAVDLGMLAVSRTECQNSADAAALAGCRTLNNKPTAVNNDLALAVTNARATVTGNYHLSTNFDNSQIQKIEAGQYLYDPTAGVFRVATWIDVTNSQSAAPPSGSGSWTGIRVTLAVTQPTYFMGVFGVTTMPTGAVATAVYRPRDIAFVLDMTSSMGYASQFNFQITGQPTGQSLNPDNLFPAFGHYVSIPDKLQATVNQSNGSGEAISRNNYTMATSGGPPIVRYFYFDPVNVTTPATSAFPVSVSGGNVSLKNAFHRWTPPESGGDPTNYIPSTYDFTGYNAYNNGTETNPMGPTPAPDTFGTMTDSGSNNYVGDRYRRADGSINKTDTTWATGAVSTKAATTLVELLGYHVNTSTGAIAKGTSTGADIATFAQFRDPVWEAYGYDLDIVKYRTWKTGSNSDQVSDVATYLPSQGASTSTPANVLVKKADQFQGFSMGPGYWGKTFYIWPPDPRWGGGTGTTDPTNLSTTNTAQDANGNWICDWRRRFFTRNGGGQFDPQTDNGAGPGVNSIDAQLINSSTAANNAGLFFNSDTTQYAVNYTAILKWIKSGPQVLPPNLRAGRVLYYSSIPDDVNTAVGTAQVVLDKVFWREYINYVLGRGYTNNGFLYGRGDSWSAAPVSVSTSDMATWNGPNNTWTPQNQRPYIQYNDSPYRPRLNLWFGPLSMMDYLGLKGNWLPGTCTEAQCWQLKAGMSGVIDDLRNNHPNDYAGLVMFAADAYNDVRRPIGQNYQSLKNALFYPKTLLDLIDAGDITTEFNPFDTSFNDLAPGVIPNANGTTDPNTGLAYGFNVLSPSTLTGSQYGTIRGRRGASKVVIFETDGVPNTYRGLTSTTRTMNPTLRGYNTYYPISQWSSGFVANGDATAESEAYKVVQQIVQPMANNANNNQNSGLSLPNAPARVYPIGFGDIFDPIASPNATFRTNALAFLATIAFNGNTGPSGATAPPSSQIITGSYQQRISRLKDCMQRIFQSGVAVALIE